jgi:hypothetical protein
MRFNLLFLILVILCVVTNARTPKRPPHKNQPLTTTTVESFQDPCPADTAFTNMKCSGDADCGGSSRTFCANGYCCQSTGFGIDF